MRGRIDLHSHRRFWIRKGCLVEDSVLEELMKVTGKLDCTMWLLELMSGPTFDDFSFGRLTEEHFGRLGYSIFRRLQGPLLEQRDAHY